MRKPMNQQVVWAALAVACLVLIPTSFHAQENHVALPPPDQVEILSTVRKYYDDLSARDWQRFASNFWDGATIATVWAPEGPGSKPIFEETMGQSKILLYQNLAIAWVEYEARFGEPDDLKEWSGIDAISLLKDGGKWKITSIAFASE
jgi:hypothetical protein